MSELGVAFPKAVDYCPRGMKRDDVERALWHLYTVLPEFWVGWPAMRLRCRGAWWDFCEQEYGMPPYTFWKLFRHLRRIGAFVKVSHGRWRKVPLPTPARSYFRWEVVPKEPT